MRRAAIALALAAATAASGTAAQERDPEGEDRRGGATAPPFQDAGAWGSYGGDAGGTRFSRLTEITPSNVVLLERAWIFHTGEPVQQGDGAVPTALEATPILFEDTLVLCTPRNRVIALDAVTGVLRWAYDPLLAAAPPGIGPLTCRGVASWIDAQREGAAPCARRIFSGTQDARLLALDAVSGLPCSGFGADGTVDLRAGLGEEKTAYRLSSPPAVVRDLVIVGGAVDDDAGLGGRVRAFDARRGALRWTFALAPRELSGSQSGAAGAPDAWSVMSVDAERDLVFVPTGNPSFDARAREPRLDHFGSSVVALRASTGELVWSFQTVHQDVWEYDVAAQPSLVELEVDGKRRPALLQATKTGLLFALDRESGKPLLPVEERPVPGSSLAGLTLAPTQPFPVRPPPLVGSSLRPLDAFGLTLFDRGSCRQALEGARFEGIFTPPRPSSPTLVYPGNAGGVSWGGLAFSPEHGVAVANATDVAWIMEPAASAAGGEPSSRAARDLAAWVRRPLRSPVGLPCNPPPWGWLGAWDLRLGTLRWRVPLGTMRDLAPVPLPLAIGTPNAGGPIVTASGLVFIGAASDDYLRAFDLQSGAELWRGRLPAGGQATPMTFLGRDGRQYVVISAGGHASLGTRLGDAVVAFALPR